MKTIKLFLASSEELKPERLVIAEMVTQLNYSLAKFNVAIRLVKWEYLDSSMGVQHKQEDYNDYLRQCDMCVVLFWTKFGMYTEIELKLAYELMMSNSKLKNFCVLFKNSSNMTPQLQSFIDRFGQEHPDYCYSFLDEAELKQRLSKMIEGAVNDKFEQEYKTLSNEVRKLNKLLSVTEDDDPDKGDYLDELHHLENELMNNRLIVEDIKNKIVNI